MKESEKKLLDEFKEQGCLRGSSLFLDSIVALQLIERARTLSLPILGIESFLLSPKETRPCLEHILDLSDDKNAINSWDLASSFVSERAENGFHFEIVLG